MLFLFAEYRPIGARCRPMTESRSPKDCRDRAAYFRHIAETEEEPRIKEVLLQLATEYEELAAKLDDQKQTRAY